MKKNQRAAVLRNSKKNQLGISKEIRVINLKSLCGIDQAALCGLAEIINPASHANLYYKACDILLGFDAHAQVAIVEALQLYISDGIITLSGIGAVNHAIVNLNRLFDRLVSNPLKPNEHERD